MVLHSFIDDKFIKNQDRQHGKIYFNKLNERQFNYMYDNFIAASVKEKMMY